MPVDSTQLLEKPVFVLGCSRSGTTLLFRNLGGHPGLWTYYEELPNVFYRRYPVDPELGDRVNRPPTPEEAEGIRVDLFQKAHNKEIHRDVPVLRHLPRKLFQRPISRPFKSPPIRLIEKTPSNSLRIPLLASLFPDARFIFLIRRPEDVISSLMEGWKLWTGVGPDGRWQFEEWREHYVRPPGWQEWRTRTLQEICAFQWVRTNEIALEDLERHCPNRYMIVRHEAAVADPQGVYEKLRVFCNLPPSRSFAKLVGRTDERVFTHGGSPPRPEKWRMLHEDEVESVRPMFQGLRDRLYGSGVQWNS